MNVVAEIRSAILVIIVIVILGAVFLCPRLDRRGNSLSTRMIRVGRLTDFPPFWYRTETRGEISASITT